MASRSGGTRIVATPSMTKEFVHWVPVGPKGLAREGIPNADVESIALDVGADQCITGLEAVGWPGRCGRVYSVEGTSRIEITWGRVAGSCGACLAEPESGGCGGSDSRPFVDDGLVLFDPGLDGLQLVALPGIFDVELEALELFRVMWNAASW